MTQREKEILEILKCSPLISQQELADKLGITRSSASVHIGNLMKKGIIAGKGYVIQEEKKVCVIGGMDMDVQGFPKGILKMKDSNPGTLRLSPGGVGRNIAENLAKLEIPVRLLSAVAKDPYGDALLESCRLSGIDIQNLHLSKEHATAIYLSVMDEEGDMRVAIAQMEILEEINRAYIKTCRSFIQQAPILVVDANLPSDTLMEICSQFCHIPLFADPVSSVKAMRLEECLPHLYGFKPNKMEASALLRTEVETFDQVRKAAERFLKKGIQEIYISMGEEGVLCANQKEQWHIQAKEVAVCSATGAGDAFVAGAVYGKLQDLPFDKTAEFAMAASLLALSGEETVHPDFSKTKIDAILNQEIIQIKALSF